MNLISIANVNRFIRIPAKSLASTISGDIVIELNSIRYIYSIETSKEMVSIPHDKILLYKQ